MNFSRLDIFSSPFQFDFGNEVKKKSTIYGAILSLILIIVMTVYSAYLFYLFINNQFNPTFSSQSFVSEDTIDLELSEELVGFRYEYGVNLSLDDLEAQKNKTYLVFVPYFYYQIGTYFQLIPLNYTKCTTPKLQGFNCFDFSTVKNYTLTLSTSQNFFTNVYLFVYKCSDTDQFNSFIPNNCVDDYADYNSVINNPFAQFRLKLYTSQYNTTSQKKQVSYMNSYAFLQGDQFSYFDYKTQKQITKVKEGSIIQFESTFTSPIEYILKTVSFDRQSFFQATNQTSLLQITLEVDEIIQYVQIQYITFTQILSQCNSTLALLMCLGFLGRKFSLKLMREDIFLLLLQNLFHGTYQTILRKSNFLDLQNACVSKVEGLNDGKNQLLEENEKIERNEFITVPSFFTKSIKQVDNQNNLLYTEELNTQIQNICKNEVKVQEVLNKSKFDNSVMNFDKRLNDQQRRNQIRKNQTNLPLTKKGQIEIQKFNSQQVQNLKDKEIMQETSFLGSNRSGIFNRSQFIQTDSKQFQAKSPYISNNIQEYHIKRAKAIQNSTILKDRSYVFKEGDYDFVQLRAIGCSSAYRAFFKFYEVIQQTRIKL